MFTTSLHTNTYALQLGAPNLTNPRLLFVQSSRTSARPTYVIRERGWVLPPPTPSADQCLGLS